MQTSQHKLLNICLKNIFEQHLVFSQKVETGVEWKSQLRVKSWAWGFCGLLYYKHILAVMDFTGRVLKLDLKNLLINFFPLSCFRFFIKRTILGLEQIGNLEKILKRLGASFALRLMIISV